MFEHVKGATPDLAKENLEKLKALFPGVVTEGPDGVNINVEALKQECSATPIEGNVEHYEFTWPGKRAAKAEAYRPTTKTLRPCRAESVGKDGTPGGFDSENLYIEGDNLEVLKLLRMNYTGAVKMIYIDPPYNTGKDFVYRDSFSLTEKEIKNKAGSINEDGAIYERNDSAEARYHTNWCNMMLPRLKLAKDLLREDGVIFISIDDNEVANLYKLGMEVFGEANFEGHIHWRRRHNQPNDRTKMIGLVAEHVLCFAKSSVAYKASGVGKMALTGEFTNPDNDPNGPWASKPWKVGSDQSGCRYVITTPTGKILDEEWMGEKETYEQHLKDGRIYFPKGGDGFPRKKYYKFEREEEGQCATNWWLHDIYGHNQGANEALASLFGEKNIFSNPKPVQLIKGMIDIANVKAGQIVLDFFSGSATIAESVMEANVENANIRCILVQLREDLDEAMLSADAKAKKTILAACEFLDSINKPHNICEIGKERIRRAGKKILDELKAKEEKAQGELSLGDGGEAVVTKPDVGFRVLKLAEGSYLETSKKVGEITQESLANFSKIKDDRSGEDLLFQMLLETDIKLSESIDEEIIEGNKVYFVGGTAIAAALEKDMRMTEEFVKALAARKPGTVFFRDDSFGGRDDLKISVEQIFKQMTGDLTKVKVI